MKGGGGGGVSSGYHFRQPLRASLLPHHLGSSAHFRRRRRPPGSAPSCGPEPPRAGADADAVGGGGEVELRRRGKRKGKELGRDIVASRGNWREAMGKLQRARSDGVKLPMSAFAAVAFACASSGRYAEAIDLKGLAEADGLCPHLSSRFVTSLMKAYTKMGRATEAADFVQGCFARGLALDKIVCTAAFRSFALARRAQDAVDLLRSMDESGIRVDILAINMVLDSLSREGRFKEALVLLERAETLADALTAGKAADSFSLDAAEGGNQGYDKEESYKQLQIAFSTAITACARAQQPAHAKRVLQRMLARGYPPDLQSMNSLLSSYGAAGLPGQAEAIFQTIPKVGLTPDAMSFNNLLQAYVNSDLKDSDLRMAITDVLRRMMDLREQERHPSPSSSGIIPNIVTYNLALKGTARTGEGCWEDASTLLEDLKSRGLEPDSFTYSAAMSCAAAAGLWKQTLSLLHTAEREKLESPAMYTTCIRSLSGAGYLEEALSVFGRMGSRQDGACKPDVRSYTAILSACARAGEVEQALELWEEMRTSGIKPNLFSFAAIIDACGKSGDADTSFAIFQLMRKEGVEPDEAVYNVMVAAMAEGGKPVTARLLLGEMQGFGFRLHASTERILRECFTLLSDDGGDLDGAS